MRRPTMPAVVRATAQVLLGSALVLTGAGHLTWLREEFRAQVPSWFPVPADAVVLGSGVAELVLGGALLGTLVLADPRGRIAAGTATAAFFVVIFPGNVAQYVEGTDGFGLETDQARLVRLFFQPALVAWALWSTGAWGWLRARVSGWRAGR